MDQQTEQLITELGKDIFKTEMLETFGDSKNESTRNLAAHIKSIQRKEIVRGVNPNQGIQINSLEPRLEPLNARLMEVQNQRAPLSHEYQAIAQETYTPEHLESAERIEDAMGHLKDDSKAISDDFQEVFDEWEHRQNTVVEPNTINVHGHDINHTIILNVCTILNQAKQHIENELRTSEAIHAQMDALTNRFDDEKEKHEKEGTQQEHNQQTYERKVLNWEDRAKKIENDFKEYIGEVDPAIDKDTKSQQTKAKREKLMSQVQGMFKRIVEIAQQSNNHRIHISKMEAQFAEFEKEMAELLLSENQLYQDVAHKASHISNENENLKRVTKILEARLKRLESKASTDEQNKLAIRIKDKLDSYNTNSKAMVEYAKKEINKTDKHLIELITLSRKDFIKDWNKTLSYVKNREQERAKKGKDAIPSDEIYDYVKKEMGEMQARANNFVTSLLNFEKQIHSYSLEAVKMYQNLVAIRAEINLDLRNMNRLIQEQKENARQSN